MTLSYSHGREFVEQVRPFLENHDPCGLVRYLNRYWPRHTLCEILSCGHSDAVKVGSVCLGLMGNMADNSVLAPLLHDEDASVVPIVEHAMWSIWFRAADVMANNRLERAVRLISENDFVGAIAALDSLVLSRPDFAEAYNQRAIAWFLLENYRASLADCRRTLRLNPFHFGAMAGVGHCHASLGSFDLALDAYSRALQMHPRMDGIQHSVQQLRLKLSNCPTPAPLPAPPTGSALP